MLKDLYNYRELLRTNVKKEIRGKYKGSFLGVLWSFVNPLLMTLIYAIVFPFLLRSTQPHYVTFVVIAVLPWNWFTLMIAQSTTVFLSNAGIIKKVYFPREILPISVVTSGLVNYVISLLIIAMFLICSGIGFSIYLIYLPLIIIVQFILSLAISFFVSAINVYVRDAEYIINFFVQMLFYATPIIFTLEMFPVKFQKFLILNPMVTIINSYRDIMFYQRMPQFKMLGVIFVVCIGLLFISLKIFRKLEKGFVEEL